MHICCIPSFFLLLRHGVDYKCASKWDEATDEESSKENESDNSPCTSHDSLKLISDSSFKEIHESFASVMRSPGISLKDKVETAVSCRNKALKETKHVVSSTSSTVDKNKSTRNRTYEDSR